jgi:hypothetical protein
MAPFTQRYLGQLGIAAGDGVNLPTGNGVHLEGGFQ